jgi:hypothetical protein
LTALHRYLRDSAALLTKKILGLIEGAPKESETLATTPVVRQI